MALTVREAMALGGLRRGEVLAGAGGLDRTITWVKVLESPETISWLAEGELLLTVAFAIKDDQAAQKDLMRNLAAVGSAGLVIKPERYLPQIPEDMIGQADEFKIPLIRIPPDVSYLEIMNPILERIINAQNSQLRRSIEIHRQFTHLALDGQGLDAIVKTLGELVESSISLEDVSFHLLASHVVPGVTDKHRQQTLAHHGTPLKVRQAAAIKSMLQDVVRDRAPHKVPPFPDLGLTAPRIIAPVLAGRENLGYLSIIDHPQHLEELAVMAVEHAATVIALEMIKQREVAEAEDRVRGELVDDLLNGTFGDEANVQRRSRLLRYGLGVPHRLLVVDVAHFGRFIRERRYEEGRVIALKHQLFQVVTGAVRRQHPRHLVSAHSDSVIVLVPQPADGKDPEAEALAARIREAVAESELGITVSVPIGRLCLKPDDFKPAFAEAQRALDLMVRFGKREQVINYERLGVYRLLAQVEDRAGLDAFAGRMLAPLVDYDRARGTPLLKTLEVYLQRHGNLRQSSRDLHIHLNTLHYRLRRISEVTGVDLKGADARRAFGGGRDRRAPDVGPRIQLPARGRCPLRHGPRATGNRPRHRARARAHPAGPADRLRRFAHLDPRRLWCARLRHRDIRGRARPRHSVPAPAPAEDDGGDGRWGAAAWRHRERHCARHHRADRRRRRPRPCHRVPRVDDPRVVDGRAYDGLQHDDRGRGPRGGGGPRRDHVCLRERATVCASGAAVGGGDYALGGAGDRC